MDTEATLRARLGAALERNASLARYTTFRVGGSAAYLLIAQTSEQVEVALTTARQLQLPVAILGGGTNTLVADAGFPGLVIVMHLMALDDWGSGRFRAGAGVKLSFLARETASRGWSGFEWAIAVPGTVGGAIYGNAGLPRIERGATGDWVESVTVWRDGGVSVLTPQDCGFGYRTSAFKQRSDVILEAIFALGPGNRERSVALMDEFVRHRRDSQPYNSPSCGCSFKNPLVNGSYVSAGALIDRAGLKGTRVGGAEVSRQHGNFIINTGSATASDIAELIALIKAKVKAVHGVDLEEEVRYLGF